MSRLGWPSFRLGTAEVAAPGWISAAPGTAADRDGAGRGRPRLGCERTPRDVDRATRRSDDSNVAVGPARDVPQPGDLRNDAAGIRSPAVEAGDHDRQLERRAVP